MPTKIEGQRAEDKDLKKYYTDKGPVITRARDLSNEAKTHWEKGRDREAMYAMLGALDALVTLVVLEDYWAGGE